VGAVGGRALSPTAHFLGLGRRTLLDEAPDVLERVLDDGAFENRQFELAPGDTSPGDESLVSICTRRPVFESALRAVAEAEADVRLEGGARIAGLLGAPVSGNGGVRVTGIRTNDGRTVEADLVVDALGRTSPVHSWLEELGARPTAERRSECGLLYYSRHFRLRPASRCPRCPPCSADRAVRRDTSSSSSSSGTTGHSPSYS
jgi:2-polyprenyl-6-methoxyphenol hydroxylase-like FAD-dependent oxidoreductase